MLQEDQKRQMLWGLSPQELSSETTKETHESSGRFCSPKLVDEDAPDMFHPYRRCAFVHSEK